MVEPNADSIALGYRTPPDKITYACTVYLARVMELRDFIAFFFGIIKSTDEFTKSLTEASKKAFQQEADKYRIKPYSFSIHRQFVNELMLSRAVESFDLYVLIILRVLFAARPEMLKSEGSIDISTVIDLKNFDDILTFVVERKVHELGYKSLADLRKYVLSRAGIDLFRNDEIFETVLLASEVRNLIAHNDCRVNDVFKSKISVLKTKDSLPISDSGKFTIDDDWVRKVCYTLDGAVFDFDSAAAKKFEIETLNRKSSFIFRL